MNEYIGWYEQSPEDADTSVWHIGYQKPLIVSEFGGDAKAGLDGAPTKRWTEEYQANIFRHQLPMLAKIPQFRGLTPWTLMDFRSPMTASWRTGRIQSERPRLSNLGKKKEAFFVLQKIYRDCAIHGVTSSVFFQPTLGAHDRPHSPVLALGKVANPDK